MTASLLGACAPARPRSLVLVSVDTLRADHVGAYGGKLGSTPSMDSLAKDGVLFEDCSSAAPITGPAHATLLSGLYPPDHGVRSNGFHLAASVTTLAEMLSGRGFRTGAVIGGFPLDRRFGFDQGFGSFDDALGPPAGGNGEPERPARAVADAALAWLDAVPVDQPFFLFVHFYDPHADYRPPMDLARLPPYDGEIASVDRELGRILTRLRERGLDRSTAVILDGDHGESLGEHGEDTHAIFVYQATLRVPLLMRLPGVLPPGTRIAAPVSLVDVVPTALDLLSIPPPGKLSGISLVRPEEIPPDRVLYFESLLGHVEYRWAKLTGVRMGPLKLIRAPRPEVYRVDRDPRESANLYGDAIGTRLERELDRLAGSWPSERIAAAAPPVPLDEEAIEKLESLGYLGAGGAAFGGTAGDGPDPKDRVVVLREMAEGMSQFRAECFDDAATIYQDAASRDPGNAIVWHMLGKSRANQDRFVEAEEAMGAAFARAEGPFRATILRDRAAIALRREDRASARELLRAALDVDPGNRAATELLATLGSAP